MKILIFAAFVLIIIETLKLREAHKMALTQDETNAILESFKTVKFGGLTDEQKALLEKIPVLVDSQAADTAAFEEIRAKITELEGTDENVETVLNALKELLPKETPPTA